MNYNDNKSSDALNIIANEIAPYCRETLKICTSVSPTIISYPDGNPYVLINFLNKRNFENIVCSIDLKASEKYIKACCSGFKDGNAVVQYVFNCKLRDSNIVNIIESIKDSCLPEIMSEFGDVLARVNEEEK